MYSYEFWEDGDYIVHVSVDGRASYWLIPGTQLED